MPSRSSSRDKGRRRRRKSKSRSYRSESSEHEGKGFPSSTRKKRATSASKKKKKQQRKKRSRSPDAKKRKSKSADKSRRRKHSASRTSPKSRSRSHTRKSKKKSSPSPSPSRSRSASSTPDGDISKRKRAIRKRQQQLKRNEAELSRKEKLLNDRSETFDNKAEKLHKNCLNMKNSCDMLSRQSRRSRMSNRHTPQREVNIQVGESAFRKFTPDTGSSDAFEKANKNRELRQFYKDSSQPLNFVETVSDANSMFAARNELTSTFTSDLLPYDVCEIPDTSTAMVTQTPSGTILHGAYPSAVLAGVQIKAKTSRRGGLHEMTKKQPFPRMYDQETYILTGKPDELEGKAPALKASTTEPTPLQMHGVHFHMKAKNGGVVKQPTSTIMAVASKADPHARLPGRESPLADDHPDVLALEKAGLQKNMRDDLISLVKHYDVSKVYVPPKHQGFAIEIQPRATVPLLTSFTAAGALPWTTFANIKAHTKAPWMRLTTPQLQDSINRYCEDSSGLFPE